MNTLPKDCFILLLTTIFVLESGFASRILKNHAKVHKKSKLLTIAEKSLRNPSLFPYIPEDAWLPITELIPKYGYPLEVHKVTTEDGYILTLHRIPHGQKPVGGSRPAVLVMHGMLGCSDDWVALGPRKGLGYILADAGYDVWLGNARGTKHSREHVRLSPNRLEFWDFSFDEIGLNDVPALVDYVVTESGNRTINYVGLSQGTSVCFIALSLKPSYNRKIKRAVMLAPVAYGSHIRSPTMIIIIALSKFLHNLSSNFARGELEMSFDILNLILAIVCNVKYPTIVETCVDLLYTISGYDDSQLNRTMLPLMLAHASGGVSTKQLVHVGQMYREARVGMFDFGRRGNMKRYNAPHPPDYPLEKITAPMLLIHSKNDLISDPVDVELLYKRLPNAEKYLVPWGDFGHIDFIWANDVKKLVYDKVIDAMNSEIYINKLRENDVALFK